jgi:hypothetical protein
MQTFKRKLEQIEARYPEMAPKVILKKLMGKDVSRDDLGRPGSSSDKSPPPVTGEQGGRLVACYLVKLEHELDNGGDDGGVLGDNDAKMWLENAKANPIVMLRPATKLCVEKAIKFLPKLKAGLAASARAAAAANDNEDDLDGLFD